MKDVYVNIRVKPKLSLKLYVLFIKTVAFFNIEIGYKLLNEFKLNADQHFKVEVL